MGADQAGAEQQGMQEAYSLGVPHVKVGPALHMLRASLHVHLSIRNRWQAGQLHELSHVGAVAAWEWAPTRGGKRRFRRAAVQCRLVG